MDHSTNILAYCKNRYEAGGDTDQIDETKTISDVGHPQSKTEGIVLRIQ